MTDKSQPTPKLKKPPVLFTKTQKIIKAISAQIDGTFLSYWHSPGGNVCHNDVMGFFELLSRIGSQDRITLFIKSGGGNGTASLRIVNLLRRYTKQLTALLPLECASAATMIALGTDEIQMGPLAYLTAVDTSIIHSLSPTNQHHERVRVSNDELNRVVKLWLQHVGKADSEDRPDAANPYSALLPFVHPLVIGAVDRSSSLSVKLCTEILSFHMKDKKKAEQISIQLNSAYPAHNYPILQQEACRVGLNATELEPKLNSMLLDLHELYSEMGQQAITDYDEKRYHNNEIVNIIESDGIQVYYQNDKDWHFSTTENRWIAMNDNSSWRKIERAGNKTVRSVIHIR